ncbi:hypothetical protein BTZ20_2861 [Rhodococcus sp. MTM3W5.2]|nr:hypothetical protein BTZ20_2861 [Rhodococcus sp. MTM3W5.2]
MNGYTAACLGAHRVFIADACSGDEVAAWLQGKSTVRTWMNTCVENGV